MWIIVATLIGVIGTIFIERLHRKPDDDSIWAPVRADNGKSNHYAENYRR
jgi:hypothetical protein